MPQLGLRLQEMEASPKHTSPGTGSGAVASRLLMLQPDAVLCKLSARGSDDAFAVLHSRYRQQVFAFVFHLLDRPSARDDAEDITQEVFSKAYTAMHSKTPDGSFKHWLFTIARNRTFDAIRALKPNAIPIDTTEDTVVMPTSGRSASSEAEAKQELAWLVGTVSGLPERQREALVMRELAGMSHTQIADALHTSVPATKQLISRGRDSVHEAARENGYRSRRLGRELAMAAPILPFVAFNFGAATASASAATTSAGIATGAAGATASATGATAAGSSAAITGVGGLALGTKVAATILTVAAIGGGTVIAERAVTDESAQTTSASAGGAGNGSGSSNPASNGLTPAEAQEQAAEKKRAARAKAKRAKLRAKAKRERAAARAKQKRVNAKKEALRKQNAANNSGTNGTASDGSQPDDALKRAPSSEGGSGGKEGSPAPSKPESSEPPADPKGGSGQGDSGDKGKP